MSWNIHSLIEWLMSVSFNACDEHQIKIAFLNFVMRLVAGFCKAIYRRYLEQRMQRCINRKHWKCGMDFAIWIMNILNDRHFVYTILLQNLLNLSVCQATNMLSNLSLWKNTIAPSPIIIFCYFQRPRKHDFMTSVQVL